MSSNLHIAPSHSSDLPRLMHIFLPAFASSPWMSLVGFTNDAAGHELAAEQHMIAWEEYAKVSSVPMGVKCVHTEGEETIIAQATWETYTTLRSEEEFTKAMYLLRADWVEDASTLSKARSWIAPSHHRRVQFFAGNPHGELYFLCTDPAWKRQGAGTKCVEWGLQRSRELGVPAWLESSEKGRGLYERLGFEAVESEGGGEGRGMPMVWWPEGWRGEDKRPVMPEWKAC